MESSNDDKAHVSLRLSLRGFKSALTRLGDKIEGFMAEGLQENSKKLAVNYSEKLSLQMEKLEAATDKLASTNPSDLEELYNNLDEENRKFVKLHARLSDHIIGIEKTTREAAATALPPPNRDAPSASIAPGKFVDNYLKPFTLTKNHNPQELRRWIKDFVRYFESGPLHLQPISRQRGFFDFCLDTELQTDLEGFTTPSSPIFGPESCLSILEERFRAFHPTFNRRVELFNVTKRKGEDSSSFLTRVKSLGLDADIGLLDTEGILAFIFLAADGDEEIRKEVSRQKTTSLNVVRDIVEERVTHLRENEAANLKAKSSTVAAIAPVAAIPPRPTSSNFRNRPGTARPDRRSRHEARPQRPVDLRGRCPRCAGTGHRPESCFVLAQGLTCHFCSKAGHIAPACRQRLSGTTAGATIGAIAASGPVAASVLDDAIVDGDLPEVTPRLPVLLSASSGCFKFESFPDSGSGACVISEDLAKKHKLPLLPPSKKITFSSVTGQRLRVVGRVILDILVISSGKARKFYFEVTPDVRNDVLLGYEALKNLNIISKSFPINKTNAAGGENYIVESQSRKLSFIDKATIVKDAICAEFNDVLDGKLPDTPMSGNAMNIFLNDRTDIRPTKVTTARAVPLHFQADSDELVRKLLKEGVIARVDTPTEWCAPAFFVKKPSGGLRLVTDFTGLNRRVKRPVHPFPAPQDIISGLSPSSTVFAKLDALSGYHQVPLTDPASFLTTFLLPSGMYRYLRAPMGLSSSSDEFCRRSDAVFAGLPGIRKLVDDILVEGKDLEDLKNKIEAILLRCREAGFILSKKNSKSDRKSTSPGSPSLLTVSALARAGLKPSPSSRSRKILRRCGVF